MAKTEHVNILINAKDKTKAALGGVTKNLLGVVAALAALKIATDVLLDIAKVGAESEKEWLAVAGALKRHNIEVESGIAQIRKFADEMQTLTGVSDEIVAKGIRRFIDFGASIAEASEQMRVATDLAVGSGMSLEGAVDLISKAQVGYTSTLSRYGIIIDEAIPKNEKFAAAMEQINEKFGGAAQDVAGSFAVRMEVLSERFGDLKEDIFKLLQPALEAVLESFIALVEAGALLVDLFDSLKGFLSGTKTELDITAQATSKWTTQIDKLITALDVGKISMENFKFALANIGVPRITNRELNEFAATIGIVSDATHQWVLGLEKVKQTIIPVNEELNTQKQLALLSAETTLRMEEGFRSVAVVQTDLTGVITGLVESMDKLIEKVEQGQFAWQAYEETIELLQEETDIAAQKMIDRQNEIADRQNEIADQWIEKWWFVQDSMSIIFEDIFTTLVTNASDMKEVMRQTFADIGRSIVRYLVNMGVKALFKYIATTIVAKKAQTQLMAVTVAQTAATTALSVASGVATGLQLAESAVVQRLGDAYWRLAAAKAAASLGLSAGPSIAGAAAVKAGQKSLGFDNPLNDEIARRNGMDFGREFMSGLLGSLAAPGFGQAVTGAVMNQVRPAAKELSGGGLTLIFNGPVTNEQFVTDTIIPAIENAVLNGASRLVLADQNETGGGLVGFA